MRKIENDEQLKNSLEWLLEKAKQMEHPLMTEEAKAELMAKYDFVSSRVEEYRREQTLLKFPYLYRIDGTEAPEPEVQGDVKPDPEPAPQQAKPVNLSAWLDD
ncbi:hypothetical protein P9G84_31860 [Brevibacillus centrosporus]|uniref:hypothetical protein n=1 Tax=Brevibacillus centrosporus TaxID=54910 RepID=UPI000F0A43AD|nr:hypothetical protein [Brevibacillus centrosporus]MEC2133448.1 hypothetical protein [Brevibacillus centrosporus]RNB63165.1 hypothetical protein EDM55_29320 [Brevibacillus centrosporus]